MDTFIIQKENVNTYKQALLYLQTSIQNEAHDVFNKGHHHGALRRNKETGVISRPRQMYSTEMNISEDSVTTLMDVLDSNIRTPEQFLKHKESHDLATFIDMLTVNTLRLNKTCIMGELKQSALLISLWSTEALHVYIRHRIRNNDN